MTRDKSYRKNTYTKRAMKLHHRSILLYNVIMEPPAMTVKEVFMVAYVCVQFKKYS
jgi:hypothetical protein